MSTAVLIFVLSLGLSESIETRLPEDPGMIYTVSFPHQGSKVGIDWKNRQIVAKRTCRKTPQVARLSCQKATLDWLSAECDYYGARGKLNSTQREMRSAVCRAHEELGSFLSAKQLARN